MNKKLSWRQRALFYIDTYSRTYATSPINLASRADGGGLVSEKSTVHSVVLQGPEGGPG